MNSIKDAFSTLLLKWWEENKRDFPWRHTNNPYHVLIAEMLLRKTTAQQVAQVYTEFIQKYPSSKVLMNANEDELVKILKPLGMELVRAKLLKKLALAIEKEWKGIIPSQQKDLLKLPGVGKYTANAVLSLIYLEDVPLVDTNFIRVIERVFNVKSSKSRAREDPSIWKFAYELIPKGNSRNFNLAVLDFAALICKAKKPQCSICPLITICIYYHKTKISKDLL
ncbi:HhH-GPD family protein (plasmid) [Caldicellulosiruptor acetigenus I77R1B]|uniref:Adenine DNA glycosylase n=1 Tax=Caldicellulosiruptor acetigenus (strain ATCC 700853 / DSM 12137 / I77R1B) TaxID=632335 RepID=E4SAY6_CALA7|nr:base excision DNA repair protein [Caldicellulosiruptor acetigenus]ADQ42065.1 HhH-GPD family protein [Caldicellulosiruptor acetigenus I77R1B]